MPLQRGEFPQKFATTKKVANQLERLQFPLFNFFKNSIIVHLQKQHTIHTVHTVLYVNCWVHSLFRRLVIVIYVYCTSTKARFVPWRVLHTSGGSVIRSYF